MPAHALRYDLAVSITGKLKFALDILLRRDLPTLRVGDPAPDFSTLDHLARPIRLIDFRGKNVVLWFFPKANTPG